jgi:hypothetical protein
MTKKQYQFIIQSLSLAGSRLSSTHLYQYPLLLLLCSMILLSGCSMGQITVRASMPMIAGGVEAMNRETDLQLAEAAIPANIELMEGMIINDPGNITLRIYAAQAYYGYAYGFIEDHDQGRASRFYMRGLRHGMTALEQLGIRNSGAMTLEQFQAAVNAVARSEDAMAAFFWASSCWAKWVDMNRDNPVSFSQLPKAVILMEKVYAWDSTYYYGSPHLFFGVYYGSRAPMLGGDFKRSAFHFEQAREVTQGKLLIVDLLQAQYLARQQYDQKSFHDRLTAVVSAGEGLFPEMALPNEIARAKARELLKKEAEWF